jgi:hypothetical protein
MKKGAAVARAVQLDDAEQTRLVHLAHAADSTSFVQESLWLSGG